MGDFYLCVDWTGVVLLIFASFASAIHIGFECHPPLQRAYFFAVFFVIFLLLVPMFFVWPKRTSFRAKAITLAMFGSFGAIIIPFHWLYFLAPTDEYAIFLPVSIQFFLSYFVGFVCFIFRLPERLKPGMFDLIGSSHNIWH